MSADRAHALAPALLPETLPLPGSALVLPPVRAAALPIWRFSPRRSGRADSCGPVGGTVAFPWAEALLCA